MINIVQYKVGYNDLGKATSLQIKLKVIKEESLSGYPLLSTVSAAFFKTTLYDDVGKTFKPELDQRRNNIVDLNVSFKENELTFEDIALFLTAFRKALDDTSIF